METDLLFNNNEFVKVSSSKEKNTSGKNCSIKLFIKKKN